MKLLRSTRADEASADYLYARIRSRRSSLNLGGTDERFATGDPWQALRDEHLWVYARLNRRMRDQLQPVFEYEELRNLILALRYLAAQDRSALLEVLNGSLLNRSLVKSLIGATRVATAVASVERLLRDDYPFCQGLTEIYLRQGPGGLEQALNGGFLQLADRRVRWSVVRLYFRYLIDMRNLLALYKHLHWQLPLPPPLIEGGNIRLTRLNHHWVERNMDGVSFLARKLTGLDDDPFKGGFEEMLCRGLAHRLKRAGRDPLQVGVLLDYLWRCRMTARNRGMTMVHSRAGDEQSGLEFMS